MLDKNSIPATFFDTVARYPQSPAIRYRLTEDKKETLTFLKLYEKINACAKAFELHNLAGKHVAIFSENRVEWFISDMALLAIGSVDIPRGCDSSAEELAYILSHSEASAVLVENKTMFEKIKDSQKNMSLIVLLDSSIHDPGKNIYSFNEFVSEGNAALNGDKSFAIEKAKILTKESIATIIYTSGTTGKPKGVVLTHGNILHNVAVLPAIIKLKAGEKFLSVLPIWHIYERTISYVIVCFGCFYVLTNKWDLKVDLGLEKPDVFITVPTIWVNIYNSVMKSIDQKSSFSKRLAKFLIRRSIAWTRYMRYKNNLVYLLGDDKKESIASNYEAKSLDKHWHKLAQKKVYQKLIDLTGGHLRLTISGGGALPMYVEDFLEACGITLIVGWGITETAPVVTLRDIDKNFRGTCGKPVPFVDIIVKDKDGNQCDDGVMGECWIKGPNVFKEYYKDPHLTNEAKVLDYFNSGDLGAYTKQGEIVLTGRAKETIVLLTGENIEPQPIENALLESPYILQIILVGQDKPTLGAIIVLDSENVILHCEKQNIKHKGKNITTLPEITSLIKEEAVRCTNNGGFRPYENISKFCIITSPFTIENEMLTQSLKVKRDKVLSSYAKEIEKMYVRF